MAEIKESTCQCSFCREQRKLGYVVHAYECPCHLCVVARNTSQYAPIATKPKEQA